MNAEQMRKLAKEYERRARYNKERLPHESGRAYSITAQWASEYDTVAKIVRWAADVLEAEPAGVIGAAYGDPESFAQREVTLDDKVIQKSAFRSKLIVKPTFGDEP